MGPPRERVIHFYQWNRRGICLGTTCGAGTNAVSVAAAGLGAAKGAELGVGTTCGSGRPLCARCGRCVPTGARLLFSTRRCQTPCAGKGDAQQPCVSEGCESAERAWNVCRQTHTCARECSMCVSARRYTGTGGAGKTQCRPAATLGRSDGISDFGECTDGLSSEEQRRGCWSTSPTPTWVQILHPVFHQRSGHLCLHVLVRK